MRPGRARGAAGGLLLALALLAAPADRAAALDLDSILRESSFSAAEEVEIRSVFTQADRARIPRDLLLPRLAEGTAKRVRFERLVVVLRSWQQNLGSARTFLEAVAGGQALISEPASWQLTATLLEGGAAGADVQALAAAAGGRPVSYRGGGLLYAALVGWGAPRPAAVRATSALIRSAIPPDQFPGLISLFEQGRKLRISPDRLADRVVESLPAARTVDDLRAAVLY
jgi:hypothetical protein